MNSKVVEVSVSEAVRTIAVETKPQPPAPAAEDSEALRRRRAQIAAYI